MLTFSHATLYVFQYNTIQVSNVFCVSPVQSWDMLKGSLLSNAHIWYVYSIGRVNGGANSPPIVDLPPQSHRVAVRKEKTASAAEFS